MELHVHLADFVQEQRAALGDLEQSALHGLSTRECALFRDQTVRSLEQLLIEVRAVHRNPRTFGAARVRHHLTSDAFFTRSALA